MVLLRAGILSKNNVESHFIGESLRLHLGIPLEMRQFELENPDKTVSQISQAEIDVLIIGPGIPARTYLPIVRPLKSYDPHISTVKLSGSLLPLDMQLATEIKSQAMASEVAHGTRSAERIPSSLKDILNGSNPELRAKIDKLEREAQEENGIAEDLRRTQLIDFSYLHDVFSIGKEFDQSLRNFARGIRKNSSTRLTIAIDGLGELGRGLAAHLHKKPYVRELRMFSEQFSKSPDYEDHVRSITQSPGSHQLKFFKTLEDAVDNADIVLMCTSAVRSRDPEALAKGRASTFQQDGAKLYRHGKILSDMDYGGLVVALENPVGPQLHVLQYAGLDPNQITSPIYLDADRECAKIDSLLRGKRSRIEIARIQEIVRKWTVGPHGMPLFGFPRNQSYGPGQLFDPEVIRAVLEGQVYAIEIGPKEMLASRELGSSYFNAPELISQFVEDLSRSSGRLRASTYCFWDRSFIGLPARVEYDYNGKNGNGYGCLRISRNSTAIGQLNRGIVKKLHRFTANQRDFVREHLPNLDV